LPIKKSLYKELLMFSIFGNIKRRLSCILKIIICSFIVGVLYIIVIYIETTLCIKTLYKRLIE
jgi:hypothetical protein